MLKYYFKFAIRNISKNKIFASINIFGLCIGITCCILAFLYVQDELKYDKHFKNTDQVYLLYGNNFNGKDFSTGQPGRFLPELLENIPEIESGLRIHNSEINLKIEGKHYYPENMIFVDSNFFTFLGWELLSGDPKTALKAPFNITISEKKAKEYFGDEDPLGKAVLVDLEHPGIITGVFRDIPKQSHIQADFIISNSSFEDIRKGLLSEWGWFGNFIYLKVNKKSNIEEVSGKISSLWNKLININAGAQSENIKLGLQKFSDIYLQSTFFSYESRYGNIYQVFGFAAIALFILIIACFNFINLSTALLSNRYTEAGIKKIVGANKKHINGQILAESFIFVLCSVLFSLILTKMFLPSVNSLFNKQLELSFSDNFYLFLFLLVIFFVTLIGTSIYPSFFFSKTKPIGIINQNIKGGNRGLSFRNILIVGQFVIGIFLIISSLMVNRQMNYIRTQNLGFNKENILVIENDWDDGSISRYNLLKESIQKMPEVVIVSSGLNAPANGIWNWGVPQVVEDMTKGIPNCGYIGVDYNYLKLLDAKIISGRDFDKNKPTDKEKVVITSTASKILGLDNPVGKTLTNLWDGIDREIIGVVDDIQYNTIHDKQKPALFIYNHSFLNHAVHILVKLNSSNLTYSLKKIKKVWEAQNPTRPFGYFFLDESFNEKYQAEAQTAMIMKILTFIAIFLCCLGLFGLSIFIVSRKIKEIGVRKVNGAKVSQVILMLNKNFIIWVFSAFIFATPITWFALHKWLENFAYKIEMSWWIFALSGILALSIAVITASWQSLVAARRNPIEALRYE